MTEVCGPNVLERARCTIENGWGRLTNRVETAREGVANLALETRALVGVAGQGLRERGEELAHGIRETFDGGVREIGTNLWGRIRRAAGSLVDRVRGIGENIRGGVEETVDRCRDFGVAEGVVSRLADAVDGVREIPAGINGFRARIEDRKLDGLAILMGSFGGNGDESDVAKLLRMGVVYDRVVGRRGQLLERASMLRKRTERLVLARHSFELAKAQAAQADRRRRVVAA